ncbi:MAG: general secretion pathway protein [Alphaproteobacteria bacterium]|jgi:pilus assembly protein CpaC|nr:general secretion pathway protein [Alphaproteobacteria bacterium]
MRQFFTLCIALVAIAASALPAGAWTELKAEEGAPVLTLEKSKSTVVEAETGFSMIVLSDPQIAEAMVTTNRSFFVRGKKPGETTILLYDEAGELVEMIDLEVTMGLDALRADLGRLLPGEDITVYPVHDGIFLDGRLTTAAAADMALKVAERHVPGGVANGLTTVESQQVMLEVRFVEAGRDRIRELGFGTQFDANDVTGGTAGGLVSGLAGKAVATFTNVGTENIDVRLNALESKGVLRTLAKPNLVALSGDTASFLAGGEFPIPVANGDDEVTIQFREFGVSLAFTPTVLGDGLINLHVRPEVSSLDNRNAVRSAGVTVPALSVRRADTSVELRDGQAFAIAGLLQNSFNNEAVNTPWLSDVPVIGALFSSRRYQRKETELVIIVTPRLVQPAPSVDALATPLQSFEAPSEAEMFLLNRSIGEPADSETDEARG